MALRFRRSIKLVPGLRLNLGKRGLSLSAGVRGASVTLGGRGAYGNVGFPGTGLSFREKLGGKNKSRRRSSSTPSSTNSSRSSTPTEPFEIFLALQDDGSVKFRDADGNPAPNSHIKIARELHEDRFRNFLTDQCERWNQGIEKMLNIHLETPSPNTKNSLETKQFDVVEPVPPVPKKLGILGHISKKRADTIRLHNQRLLEDHKKEEASWQKQKEDHEKAEERKKWLFEKGRFEDVDSMQEYLEKALAELEWPRETLISFEIEDNGDTILFDVDLPEVEDMPTEQASLATRGLRLNIKKRKVTQIRKEYVTHIHGIIFRIIGEVFLALPKSHTVVISGYSQRPDKATGQIMDEYLLSVRVNRSEWERINFSNLTTVDVSDALANFDLRRKMTKGGILSPISPFESAPE